MSQEKLMHNQLVSIAIPVFNGAEFISESIESIIAQDYQNIELIISDNASTDNTESICRDFCKKDKRIIYIRQKKNIGGVSNYTFLLNQAKGKFFSWCGADDKFLSKNLISSSVDVLEKNKCSICIPKIKLIDKAGFVIKNSLLVGFKPKITKPIKRLKSIMNNFHVIYSVYKTEDLRKYIKYYEKHKNLSCCNEGLFVITIFSNLLSYYNTDVSRAYRVHNENWSVSTSRISLIKSNLIFLASSVKYLVFNINLSKLSKIFIILYLSLKVHKYIFYLLMSIIFNNILKKFK